MNNKRNVNLCSCSNVANFIMLLISVKWRTKIWADVQEARGEEKLAGKHPEITVIPAKPTTTEGSFLVESHKDTIYPKQTLWTWTNKKQNLALVNCTTILLEKTRFLSLRLEHKMLSKRYLLQSIVYPLISTNFHRLSSTLKKLHSLWVPCGRNNTAPLFIGKKTKRWIRETFQDLIGSFS